ncbi:hypothetical protein MMC22_005406 [Lobaria immixta]|nr:hypothetical protein [Lobaria immixta]
MPCLLLRQELLFLALARSAYTTGQGTLATVARSRKRMIVKTASLFGSMEKVRIDFSLIFHIHTNLVHPICFAISGVNEKVLDADVQCCVREHCTAFSDPDGEYGQYSCLNTYKTDECGNGSGKFVAGHCLGDETVQCCHDQLTYVSPTTYNNPGVYPTGGQYEGTKGVVVPTEEGSGTPSSPISASGDSRAGVVVPSFPTPNTVEREGRLSAYPSSEGSTRSTYGLQPDGTFVVPTLPQAPETQRESLSWRIIPKGST